ncbi:acyl-CoA dehydrogenase family protein [Catellatospora sp. KI3]|uniref:acyl-CoA dehydrogenase family protein n=1 Tax=Catellatospora sp. KI3 TaxID=3041620 RepID=UPI002482AB07|nr:acyl-CoA dehydrogenase family protein [Catellatospora sp. KI3]MDI1459954.1 acyl-CoA dehydrogenase family protein [Catellatospora sp. KI3]
MAEDSGQVLARARVIADEVLFPAASGVDRADRVPATLLDLLADAGCYGMAAPADAGGLGLSWPEAAALVETLADGCLTTAFVWLQHHSPVRAVADSPHPELRDRWLAPLARGERRAGIALAGLRVPDAPMRVTPVDGGYLLDGRAPWVTGWGMIDTLYTAALDASGDVHFLLVDAVASATLQVRPLELVAVRASATCDVHFERHFVPADRLVDVVPYADWSRADSSGSATNGFLAIGVAARCVRLLPPGAVAETLSAQVDAARGGLLGADSASNPAARAEASAVAARAAAALAVQTGARAVLLEHDAQRLARESVFLLVFGNRPAIRDALLTRLTHP